MMAAARFSWMRWSVVLGMMAVVGGVPALAQRRPMDVPEERAGAPTRARLYLTDGTYQLVLEYKVVGKVVRFRSAERDGAEESIPLEMVDLKQTQLWADQHSSKAASADGRVVLSPELAREEAARAARMPEVAPRLHLPEEDSVLVMDTFEGTPELVPLAQQGSDLNRETAHAVLKGPIHPASTPHRIVDINGYTADVQLHVDDPVFYVHVGKDDDIEGSDNALVVDTHGASGRATPSGGAAGSQYVIERIDARADLRIVDSFRIALLGTGQKQRDVVETRIEPLPGGHWLKVTPKERLEFGEYALIEVLDDRSVNLNVWDFGVHSAAKENIEAIRPEKERPATLERR